MIIMIKINQETSENRSFFVIFATDVLSDVGEILSSVILRLDHQLFRFIASFNGLGFG